MIPEASTHLIISEALEDLIPGDSMSIETYAEGLIDDLFSDIDNILDTGRKLPAKTIRTEYVPMQMQSMAVKMQEVVLPQTVNRSVPAIAPIEKSQSSTLVFNPPSVTAIKKKNQKSKGGLGNLLMLGSTLSVMTVGILYLLQSGLLNNIIAKFTPQESPVLIPADPQADLVNYMLEALAVIDQQVPPQKTSTQSGVRNLNSNSIKPLTLPNQQIVGNISPPVTANNVPPIPSRRTNVVERIYIPYQIPPSIRPLPQTSPKSVESSPSELVKDKSNNVQSTTAKPKDSADLTRVAPPKLPAATATLPKPEPTKPTTTEQVYLPAHSAELEGLLELGKKSAALFKIGGVTRRINLGENIGATGWTLVDVSRGEAIIRRNGEVRSIYTGQKL